ncbi:MAG: hypothetical protein CVV21_10425 [Candidatus Goldiibacteriota bacterium HGW-Goldbacteria-1]|jgi:ankyrin repeat protein|nr:MAG: hypothetical protein CVV21_10425 [Candidatus Goldiibacteriota bacterium HGW-Goldbacteria-1]
MKKIILVLFVLVFASSLIANDKLIKIFSQAEQTGNVMDLMKDKEYRDAVDDGGRTALMYATSKGQVKIVNAILKALVAYKGDINVLDKDGRSALYYAVADGNADIVKSLIANGAEVNIVDKEGITPLLYAAFKKHKNVFPLLIEAGADLNAKEKNQGNTALITALATGKGDGKIGLMLVEAGADVTIKNSQGIDAFLAAAWKGKIDVLNAIIEGDKKRKVKVANPNAKDKQGNSVLIYAVQSKKIDVVKTILDMGADPTYKDSNGKIARSYANHLKLWDIKEMLVQAEADWAKKNK